MRVRTRNMERTIFDMSDMWVWMTNTFGPPEAHNEHKKRWTYGKDHLGYLGSDLINGTFDIEWFEFRDERDATLFMLRWP